MLQDALNGNTLAEFSTVESFCSDLQETQSTGDKEGKSIACLMRLACLYTLLVVL